MPQAAIGVISSPRAKKRIMGKEQQRDTSRRDGGLLASDLAVTPITNVHLRCDRSALGYCYCYSLLTKGFLNLTAQLSRRLAEPLSSHQDREAQQRTQHC